MTTRSRTWIALALLVPLVAAVAAAVVLAPWRSVLGVDNRTYVEMVAGVRIHGRPYLINGPAEAFPEGRAAFNVPHGKEVWGVYAPLYPYLAAPALRLGGLLWLTKQNVLLVGLLGLAALALATRLGKSPLRGVAAAYVVVLGTPVWISSFETLALPALYLWLVLGSLFALVAVEARGWRAWAASLATGLFAAMAPATHLVSFPMALALLVALLFAEPAVDAPATFARRWLPSGAGLARFACASVAMAIALVPVALLNEIRFGSPNPISYGPCIWNQCQNNVQDALNVASLARFALPAVPWMVAVALGLLVARRRAWAVALVIALAAAALVPKTAMRDTTWVLLRTAYGYFVDNSTVDFVYMDVPFDGLGHVRGPHVIKSMLQSSPVLLTGLVVGVGRFGKQGRVLVVLLPALALYASLALLGRFTGANAFGWPHIFIRYAIPAAPLLAVLAVEAMGDLPWRFVYVFFAAGVAVAGLCYFLPTNHDHALLRRIVELRLTVLVAVVTAALTFCARRWPRPFVREQAAAFGAAAVGLGIAVSLGVDTRALATQMSANDARLARFERVCPDRRLAIVGWGADQDPILALRAEREIQTMDFFEADDNTWNNFRVMIDVWSAEGRPIYALFPRGQSPPFRWPYADWDVPGVLLDESEVIWRIGPSRRKVTEDETRQAWAAHFATKDERRARAKAFEEEQKRERERQRAIGKRRFADAVREDPRRLGLW
jgi:hypothetical protein